MVTQGGRVQLEQSDILLALNVVEMAQGGFLRRAIEEMHELTKKPLAEVLYEKKRGVQFLGNKKVKAAIETQPAMIRENQMDGCLPR